MGVPIRHRYNIDVNLTSVSDELHNSVGAVEFVLTELKESTGTDAGWDFFTKEDLEIRTAAGGGGTLLAEGAGNDYLLSDEDTSLTTRATAAAGVTKTVYKKIQIINAAYQACDLYFTYEGVACANDNRDKNNITWIYTTKTADYTIPDFPGYTAYIYTTGTDKKTVTLPTVADNDLLRLKFMKIDSGYGPLVIDGEGAENGLT